MEISIKKAVEDLFSTEKKWKTVLLMSVCQLIPIVGPIVVVGYLFRRFASVRKGIPVEDFEFDNFGEFLQIGLWPFLASMVIGVIAVPFILLAFTPVFLMAINPESIPIVIVAGILVIILYLLIMGLAMAISLPVMLRSGLMMDFKAGFNKNFVMSFAGKVGKSLVLKMYLLLLIAIIPMLVGYLALFVGLYVVMTIMSFAQFHLLFQHYDLFLEKGGEEIPIHPEVLKSANTTPPLPKSDDGAAQA